MWADFLFAWKGGGNTISRFNCTICLRLFLSGVRSFHLA
jgi:hypothetical protein